jgi:hypothetical protein
VARSCGKILRYLILLMKFWLVEYHWVSHLKMLPQMSTTSPSSKLLNTTKQSCVGNGKLSFQWNEIVMDWESSVIKFPQVSESCTILQQIAQSTGNMMLWIHSCRYGTNMVLSVLSLETGTESYCWK